MTLSANPVTSDVASVIRVPLEMGADATMLGRVTMELKDDATPKTVSAARRRKRDAYHQATSFGLANGCSAGNRKPKTRRRSLHTPRVDRCTTTLGR